MRSGLEVLLDDRLDLIRGRRVAMCCNHTAVDRNFRHAIDRLAAAGVTLVRLFGPEHGVRATAQDMEGVDEIVDPVTGVPTVSLYGDSEKSLHPEDRFLADVDVLLFDIQDIGARFYTYQATLGFIMQVAARTGTEVIVLDRPNPIGGTQVEGNLVRPGFESFVGAFPLAVRHGMTMGELGHYFQKYCGIDCAYRVIRVDGWRRGQWLDETDLPWVYPSPNMPTLDTATLYPGLCLIEGLTWSEGRGTTKPFHLVGAPGVDPQTMTVECERAVERLGLTGVRFRPAAFIPGFQKHAGVSCTGVEIHLTDRKALNAWQLGTAVVEACFRTDEDRFGWRTETYEFVDNPIAIDLLAGNDEYRPCIESRGDLAALHRSWQPEREAFLARRREVLLYEE